MPSFGHINNPGSSVIYIYLFKTYVGGSVLEEDEEEEGAYLNLAHPYKKVKNYVRIAHLTFLCI